jgi:4-aminobutyrate aminotransferase-like enzyme
MAAMNATLDVMEREDIPARSARLGATLRDALEDAKETFAFIGDVRGMGLMQALELVEDRATKQPAPGKANQLMEAAKRHGLLLGKGGLHGNVIRMAPPMLITESELDDALARLRVALSEIK